jgi:hypothetical protein
VIPALRDWFRARLEARLEAPARAWFEATCAEIAGGVDDERFAALLSMASRHARRRPAELGPEELESAAALVPGWNPERWSRLDLLRAALVLARADLEAASGPAAVLSAVRHGDLGELVALYRSFCLLPQPDAYVWQAGEGCRSNMNEVFEAVACDNPVPAAHFDDTAWRALVIKSLFIGAPLWRVVGLDGRLSQELAHVALDLCDERRSAGRPVPPELWLCLGEVAGERGLAALERELDAGPPAGRRGAALGLARAGELERLAARRDEETDPEVRATMDRALAGNHSRTEFAPLQPFRK